MNKLFVFGVDGAFPEFVFGEWLPLLPNFKRVMERGVYAKLNSTTPPLSVTAWSSILTGKEPADTGIFEYVYRKNHSCKDFRVVTSHNLKEKTIWQILSEKQRTSIICNILLTWPIKPFNGIMITGPLTPVVKDVESVYPLEVRKELENLFGEIPSVDVPNFRTLSTKELIAGIFALTEKHCSIMHHLLDTKPWDLFFCMIPWSDRMNHLFWKYIDVKHRKYDPTSEFKDTLKDYYVYLDKKLGEFLDKLDPDTKVMILSDHGITRMHTRVNLTDWLIKEGYLVLKEKITETQEFKFDMVDWSKTRVFAIGSYEAQLFVNLQGREPEGIVSHEEYEPLVEEVIQKLAEIPGDDGKRLNTQFFRKKDFFRGKHEEDAPDAVIYFDDLEYGANTTMVAHKTPWSPQGSKGSDDAGHSKQGILIMDSSEHKNVNLGEISYLDIAPTMLSLLGIPVPSDMKGKVLT